MATGEALQLLQALVLFLTGGPPAADRLRDLSCLARNVWFEARGSPFVDKLAVAQVVVNRVRDPAHPDTVCGVVFEPHQFSWTADELPDEVRLANRIDRDAWIDSVLAAVSALDGRMPDLASGATHFHAAGVSPEWAQAFEYVARWGRHRYYRTGAGTKGGNRSASPGPSRETPVSEPVREPAGGPVLLRPVAGDHGLDRFWELAAPRVRRARAGGREGSDVPFLWLHGPADAGRSAGPKGSDAARPGGNTGQG